MPTVGRWTILTLRLSGSRPFDGLTLVDVRAALPETRARASAVAGTIRTDRAPPKDYELTWG